MKYMTKHLKPILGALLITCCAAPLTAQEDMHIPVWDQIQVDLAVNELSDIFLNDAGTAMVFEGGGQFFGVPGTYLALDLHKNHFVGRLFDSRFKPLGLAGDAPVLIMYDEYWESGGGIYVWDFERNVRSDIMPGLTFGRGPSHAISADGRYLCIADVLDLPDNEYDTIAVVRSLPDGAEVYRNTDMSPIAFTDPSTLMVRLDDGRIAELALPDGELSILPANTSLESAEIVQAVNPAGTLLATSIANAEGEVTHLRLYDLVAGSIQFETDIFVNEDFRHDLTMLAVDAERGLVFAQNTSLQDGSPYRIGRISPMGEVRVLTLNQMRFVNPPILMPDGRNLLLRDKNWDSSFGVGDVGGLRLMNIFNGDLQAFRPLQQQFHEISFSPDGSQIAVARATGDFVIRSASDGANQYFHRVQNGGVSEDVLWTRDGAAILYPSSLGVFKWTVGAAEAVPHYTHGEREVRSICYSPDSTYIAGIGLTTVKIWDVASAELLHSIDLPYRFDSEFIVPGPGAGQFTFRRGHTESSQSTLEVIDAASGSVSVLANSMQANIKIPVERRLFAYSPDGRFFAFAEEAHRYMRKATLGVFDMQTDEIVFLREFGDANISDIAFSSGGSFLLAGGFLYDVVGGFNPGLPLTVWDFRTGEEVSRFSTLPDADALVDFCARFWLSPDNRSVFMWAGASLGLFNIDLVETVSSVDTPGFQQTDNSIKLTFNQLIDNGQLNLNIELEKAGRFAIELSDLTGQTVPLSANEFMSAGVHRRRLNINGFPAGVFFLRVVGTSGSAAAVLQIVR